MTKVVLELDQRTLDRVATVARARSVSVESIIVERVTEMASLAPIAVQNPSHRAILAVLETAPAAGSTARDELHDRERDRADVYIENRRKLLALIDTTEGDMGEQFFDRARLYDR